MGDTGRLCEAMDMITLEGGEGFTGAYICQISQIVQFTNVKFTVNYTSVKLLGKKHFNDGHD